MLGSHGRGLTEMSSSSRGDKIIVRPSQCKAISTSADHRPHSRDVPSNNTTIRPKTIHAIPYAVTITTHGGV